MWAFSEIHHCQSGLTGKDLYNKIISSLESFNLDIQNYLGQGYDGAGAVAGKVNGLAGLNKLAFFLALLSSEYGRYF